MEYLASGGSRSADSSSDAAETAETAEAADGLLEKVSAVGNTVESVANDKEEEDLAHLARSWDGISNWTICNLPTNIPTQL